jgi:hypothetical protein
MKTKIPIMLAAALTLNAQAQSILFNFDNAPLYTPFPIDLTVGGVTAHFSATGQGYSIQGVSTAPVVPVGFTGRFIYPSSIFASDLLVSFSTPLREFSIQYSPQELACDSSATMRVTAYWNGAQVGTATTNAVPGTWPVETLAISSFQDFNNVVVHYDKAPITSGDYGPVFLADNMIITPAPPPVVLGQVIKLSNGAVQFAFTNTPGTSFTVLASTNLTEPLASWLVLGAPAELSSGQYQFSHLQATNSGYWFYRIRSP